MMASDCNRYLLTVDFQRCEKVCACSDVHAHDFRLIIEQGARLRGYRRRNCNFAHIVEQRCRPDLFNHLGIDAAISRKDSCEFRDAIGMPTRRVIVQLSRQAKILEDACTFCWLSAPPYGERT